MERGIGHQGNLQQRIPSPLIQHHKLIHHLGLGVLHKKLREQHLRGHKTNSRLCDILGNFLTLITIIFYQLVITFILHTIMLNGSTYKTELGCSGVYQSPMVHLTWDGHMELSVWSELGSNGMYCGIPESHDTSGTGWTYETKCME